MTGETLKTLFDTANKENLWFKPEKMTGWRTGGNQGITWKAAMGTKSLTTLKVTVM